MLFNFWDKTLYRNMLNFVQLQAYALVMAIFAGCLTTKASAVNIPNVVDLMPGSSTVDSVSAIWDKPEGEVTSFEIECIEGLTTPSSVNQTGGGPFTASCANLTTPGDGYTMIVTSLNDEGQRSEPTSISLTALPISPVLEEISVTTGDEVSATWNTPPGVVSAYAIGCNKGQTVPPFITHTGNGPFSASCVNLPTPGDRYIMYVSSLSGEQRSHRADIFLRAAPYPVIDLSELGATNDSVSAMWTKPPGVVDGYTVLCPDSSSTIKPENNDGSTHTVTCTGLIDPAGIYTILVFARSSGKLSVSASVTITLKPHTLGTDASIDSTTTSATTSENPATTESVFAITSPTTAATTMGRAIPTPAQRLELQYIIIIVVLLILLIIVAFLALLILRHRLRKQPQETDRTPLEATSHVNSVYQEIDEVPALPSNIYDDIGERTRSGSIENPYLEVDGTGRGDHATGLTGASGGISDIIKGKSEEGYDEGGVVAKGNHYVDLPVHGGIRESASMGGGLGLDADGSGSDYEKTIPKTPP